MVNDQRHIKLNIPVERKELPKYMIYFNFQTQLSLFYTKSSHRQNKIGLYSKN